MSAQTLASQTPSSAFAQRYALRKRIAVGGMAEIFLARQLTRGFEKDVVIKRIRPELVSDARIPAMFRDEARVGAFLNHPNTVHVYDVGDDNGTPYMAMEYIRGEELNALCRRGLGLGQFLPLEHAVELTRQAALSLGHFHAARDSAGHPLSIVHCDISPTNLLVTEDGFAKVIDFGIVRFRGQGYLDEAAVPGKLSYMSPEQARREKLDHRSDIYALGIVLYEITVGRRLFKGPASEVAKRLMHGEVRPPTFVSNDYPGALESIVMRALEPRAADRYASAYDFADELATFLAELPTATGPVAVARYLDRLAVAGGGERRAELVSEHEDDGGDEELDFDRGVSRELGASAQTAAAAAEWDEFEEDEQAVADALGIDVTLVRTQMRATDDIDILDVDVEFIDSSEAPIAVAARRPASKSHGPLENQAPAPAPFASSTRPRPNPAEQIRPLDPPSSIGKMVAAFVVGGVIVFLLLHFLG